MCMALVLLLMGGQLVCVEKTHKTRARTAKSHRSLPPNRCCTLLAWLYKLVCMHVSVWKPVCIREFFPPDYTQKNDNFKSFVSYRFKLQYIILFFWINKIIISSVSFCWPSSGSQTTFTPTANTAFILVKLIHVCLWTVGRRSDTRGEPT